MGKRRLHHAACLVQLRAGINKQARWRDRGVVDLSSQVASVSDIHRRDRVRTFLDKMNTCS